MEKTFGTTDLLGLFCIKVAYFPNVELIVADRGVPIVEELIVLDSYLECYQKFQAHDIDTSESYTAHINRIHCLL